NLRPDLVLLEGEHLKVREFCEERGIRCENVKIDSIEDILGGMRRIGALLGREDAATSLTAEIETAIEQIKSQRPDVEKRPRVLVCIDRRPGSLDNILTVSGGGFIDEAIEIAGGRNVY